MTGMDVYKAAMDRQFDECGYRRTRLKNEMEKEEVNYRKEGAKRENRPIGLDRIERASLAWNTLPYTARLPLSLLACITKHFVRDLYASLLFDPPCLSGCSSSPHCNSIVGSTENAVLD